MWFSPKDVRPLTPLPLGRELGAERHAFAATEQQVSLLDGDDNLILYLDTDERRLYDMKRDPAEQQDLSAEKPALADSMIREIRR